MDSSVQYSEHAKKNVFGFRQGVYAENVEFHVAKVSGWLDEQIRNRQLQECDDKGFLHHIILDMPDSYQQLEKASTALLADGNILLFSPSITQITAAVHIVRQKRLPLFMERAVELGPSLTGGKEWDVRAVRPRALTRLEEETRLAAKRQLGSDEISPGHDQPSTVERPSDAVLREGEQDRASIDEAHGFNMICRPKVFARVVGGGFLGVFRKKILARAVSQD